MKNSIYFFVLAIVSLSFFACEKDNLQTIDTSNNDYDKNEIQDAFAEAEILTGDNFYDQSDLQDVLADDKATHLGFAAQRSIVPPEKQEEPNKEEPNKEEPDKEEPKEGISARNLMIGKIACNSAGFHEDGSGGVQLYVFDPLSDDKLKYDSREYEVVWIYSDGKAVTSFKGMMTDCVCEGYVKVIVRDLTTQTSAATGADLSGTCGLNKKIVKAES